MRQHRRLIAGAGADLEHLVARVELELLGHVGHDVRLRDGLAAFDRQRDVLIGVIAENFIDELLPRHALDRTQDRGVANAATPKLHDQTDLVLRARHIRATPASRARVSSDSRFLSVA